MLLQGIILGKKGLMRSFAIVSKKIKDKSEPFFREPLFTFAGVSFFAIPSPTYTRKT